MTRHLRPRSWIARRLFGRAGAATLPGIAAVLVLVLGAAPVAASPLGDPPATRKVYPSGVQADTLDAEWNDILPVAIERLERDDWTIERSDPAKRQVVTRWKPIDHVLTRLALGDVLARCVVDLKPLSGGRTEIRVRGGLASSQDLESKPAWGAAQSAYRKAARKYLAGVRAELERQSATAGGDVGDAPSRR
jgi:hypothetical protein